MTLRAFGARAGELQVTVLEAGRVHGQAVQVTQAVRGPQSVCHTDHAATTLRRLLDWARENDLGDLDGLAVTAPSLEDTYLQLTSQGGPAGAPERTNR